MSVEVNGRNKRTKGERMTTLVTAVDQGIERGRKRTAEQVRASVRTLTGPSGRSGQGTVEYVGLILLVSLLMVGMVAAMKGFSGAQGTELAELIVDKIQSAVDKISFR
jgi:hypothetical protein